MDDNEVKRMGKPYTLSDTNHITCINTRFTSFHKPYFNNHISCTIKYLVSFEIQNQTFCVHMLHSFMSQDIVERQSSEGHQQSRQSDVSLSVEKNSSESTENIHMKQVCNVKDILYLTLYINFHLYFLQQANLCIYFLFTFTAATSGYETITCC